jgi:hypothetical protein
VPTPDRAHALDHVVVVLFENRSFDNVLGHLYGPADGKVFDGVVGRDLSNAIPGWAEHGADRGAVPYTVATDMDSPNPDSGEEWYHTNTLAPALFAKAQELGVELPADLTRPGATLPSERIVEVLRQVAAHFFPLLV